MKIFSILLFLFIFITIPIYSQITIHIPGDYPTIQEGIDAANNGDLVLVADGLYYENINFKGKAITVASHFLNDGDKAHIENTIIDGSQPANPDTGSVVLFINGEDSTSVLCGFTITGGTGILGTTTTRAGGGIAVYVSGAKICNNIIEYNSVNHTDLSLGGGIYVGFNTDIAIVKNNVIRNNSVTGPRPFGGGISLSSIGLTYILSNKITDNEATGTNASGGGIDLWASTDELIINSNYIKGNDAQLNGYGGGGIDLFNWGAPITVSNNLIVDNNARWGGGVLVDYNLESSSKPTTLTESFEYLEEIPVLVNNTIINNFGTTVGGIYGRGATPDVINNIVWGNTYTSGGQIYGANVTWSDVEGGYPGTGNIDSLPLFADLEYCLLDPTAPSPCIDAGNPNPIYNDVEDPNNPGYALYPAMGNLRNDMGTFGGPNSNWASVLSDTLYVPGDYLTIQAAIDAAINGNVVLVADGTYYENINYKGKAITVASHFLIDGNESHIENTIIDGSQPSHPDSGSVVYFISGEDTTSLLCGFTITGGTGTYNPVWSEFEGGGIFCSHAGAKIIYNKIIENEAIHIVWAAGGGIYMDFEETQRWIVIENNIISNNYVESGNGVASGGGIFSGNNARISNNLIEDNTCYNAAPTEYLYGAGIGIDGSPYWSHTIICNNNVIRNNTISGGLQGAGAGIWMDNGDFYIENNDVINNQVEGASQIEYGAGMHITSPDATCLIKGNTFSSNIGDFNVNGGAICITDASMTSVTIDANLFEGNNARYGGGLLMRSPIDASVINNLFIGNSATDYGGAIIIATEFEESQTDIKYWGRGTTNNSKASSQNLTYVQPVLINNTFVQNTADNGGAIYNSFNTELVIFNSIFWENEASIGMDLYQYSNPEVHIYYSDIETDSIFGNWIGDENIYADPLFVDASNGDFRLLDNVSPCLQTGIDSIDVGGTTYDSPPFCIYGVARPSPAGTMPDMGACENPILVGVDNDLALIPDEYSLDQNYPNPFNPSTTIKYEIKELTQVELKVFDILGRELISLVNKEQPAGSYEIVFDASALSSGVYFYKLEAGDFIQTKKMMLLK